MKIATILVSGVDAIPVDVKKIPQGISGAEIEFLYEDPMWAGMLKNVVIEGMETVLVADAGEIVPVPVETVGGKNVNIRVGVTGIGSDGVTVIPTLWAELGSVLDSCIGEFPPPEDQALPFWAQIQKQLDELPDSEAKFEALQDQIDQIREDMNYYPIEIAAISNDVTNDIAEIGSTIPTVTITWAVNKDPASQTLDGEEIPATDRSAVFRNVSADTTWTVTATDERDATDTAKTSVRFLNGLYYGSLPRSAAINSAALLGLRKKLHSTKTLEFTVTPGPGERPVYALPTRYGTPTFRIGGFTYEWEKLTTFAFTNASGYAESYGVWMHGQDVSESITVNVT